MKKNLISIFKLTSSLIQQYIKIDYKNLQEPNWDEVWEEQKLDVYKFTIDANKGRELLPVILY